MRCILIVSHIPGQVGKVLGERWKALSAKQREPYEAKAKTDKQRYEDEKASYNVCEPAVCPGHPRAVSNNVSYRPAMKRKTRSRPLRTHRRPSDSLTAKKGTTNSPPDDRPLAPFDVFPTIFLQHRISGLACAAPEQRARGGGCFA